MDKNETKIKKKIRISGNRTLIGILCILLALFITFGVAPLINQFSDRKTDIVRLRRNVERGHLITEEDIEIARVSTYNIPENVIKDASVVTGKYAAADLFAGDILFAEKLADDKKGASDILMDLNGRMAISVAIGSFAEGLSDKLKNGDIVSVIVYDRDKYMSYVVPELQYVRVIATTTSDGHDKDESGVSGRSATVTLLATREQAELLAQYNSVTSLHFALVSRGDETAADEYLRMQDEYLHAKTTEVNDG